jgi:hypothetical protein
MGAYHFTQGGNHGDPGLVCFHDAEVERFVRAALRDDAEAMMGPDAAYVGRQLAGVIEPADDES